MLLSDKFSEIQLYFFDRIAYNGASDKWGFEKEKNMDLMNELLNCLSNINCDTLNENCLNELLDSRDSAPFDTEWCRVNEEIEALKNTQSYTNENEEAKGKIREKAFMIMEENIESELAEYVSDDFGLIYDSLILNYKDKWLDKVIAVYKNKKIPSGEL
jgi:hypothetical protein